MVMVKVKTAELKSKLSSFLRKVRAGEQIIVTDRDTPIAKLVPYSKSEEKLTIRTAKRSPSIIKNISVPKALPGISSFDALMEDREDDLQP
jgi:prevent-host-death family protein